MGNGGNDYRQLSPVTMFRDRLIPLCLGAYLVNARLLRPPQLGIFLRSFPLNRPTLFAGNDRRKLLDLGRPRYGDH
jgi:hypothetical protein